MRPDLILSQIETIFYFAACSGFSCDFDTTQYVGKGYFVIYPSPTPHAYQVALGLHEGFRSRAWCKPIVTCVAHYAPATNHI